MIGFLMDQAATAAWIGHAGQLHDLSGRNMASGAMVQASMPSRELPPPLFEGNFGNYTTICLMKDDIKEQVSLNQVSIFWK